MKKVFAMPPPIKTASAILQQIPDHADLIDDLGPAQDGDERSFGISNCRAQVLDFLFHQETSHAGQQPGHTFGGRMGAVSRAEGIIDIHIRQRCQLL